MRPWYLAVLAVFVAGLVLPIWWLVAPPSGDLPGLGAYPSAYLGDTVLLPVGCMVLVIGIRSLSPARHEYAYAAIGAALAATAAIIVQAAWLQDSRPRLNWTLPQPRHFDAAGWWHAAYFTGMSAVVIGLATFFLCRVWHARRSTETIVSQLSGGPGAAILLTAFGSYTALVVHDNLPAPITGAATSSLALTGAAIVIAAVLIIAAYSRLATVLVRPAAIALGGVTVMTTFATASIEVFSATFS